MGLLRFLREFDWSKRERGKFARAGHMSSGNDLVTKYTNPPSSFIGPKFTIRGRLRSIYKCDFLCKLFLSNSSSRLKSQVYTSGDFSAISVRFVDEISPSFRTCSKLGKTLRRFGVNCSKCHGTRIAEKSPQIYTCGKSSIEEHNKNCVKNCMCKQAFTSFAKVL